MLIILMDITSNRHGFRYYPTGTFYYLLLTKIQLLDQGLNPESSLLPCRCL